MLDIVLLALADSINPCTFIIMVALLSRLGSTGRVVLGGLLFTGVVFLSYLLLGVGLLTLVMASGLYDIFRILAIILLSLLVLLEFYAFLSGREGVPLTEIPLSVRPLVRKTLQEADNLVLIPVIAFLVSITLLPCSAGPYIVALSLIGDNIALLLLYNLIFISPLLLITLLVAWGVRTEHLRDIRERHRRHMHLLSSLLLLVVLLYILGFLNLPS